VGGRLGEGKEDKERSLHQLALGVGLWIQRSLREKLRGKSSEKRGNEEDRHGTQQVVGAGKKRGQRLQRYLQWVIPEKIFDRVESTPHAQEEKRRKKEQRAKKRNGKT